MESTRLDRVNFLGSYQQYKDFISSFLWADLQAEIQLWINDINGYLEHENDIQEIYRFQGRLQSCRQLLNLPESILSLLEMTHEDLNKQEEVVTLDLDESMDNSDSYYQELLFKWGKEDLENG